MMKSRPFNLRIEKAQVDQISIKQVQILSIHKHRIELRSINQAGANHRGVARFDLNLIPIKTPRSATIWQGTSPKCNSSRAKRWKHYL